ncbi:MAG TPA: GNAT family N-acetyltransferase [Acidimicrobiales bacterium]|nr:GNAT family N-acetyltransferase [Acidimicrobiales bacterium]HLM29639.1 GNAT family N-acetyltransferase [Acidimicrobiales bacterium]
MPLIRLFTTAEASSDLLAEIRHLLDDAFGGHFTDDDWEHTRGGWHVVVVDGGVVVSHAAVVPRVIHVADRPLSTGDVEAVATAPGRQREGLGTLAMGELATVLRREFEMGALSTGLHEFYWRLGWERWRGPTFVRTGTETIRTPDEDDGVMVLRFGPSRDIDLAAPISCEARPGGDW